MWVELQPHIPELQPHILELQPNIGWVAGLSENTANSAQLELEMGLSLAIYYFNQSKSHRHNLHIKGTKLQK